MQKTDEYYLDWITDNKDRMQDLFCEQKEDEFYQFCKEHFREENI